MSGPVLSSRCAVKPAISLRPRTVSVNGTVISREAIARETQNHPAAKPLEAWQAAARALVIRELLLQEAERVGIVAEPASDGEGRRETGEEARIRALIEHDVATPDADEATCRRYFDKNRHKFRSPDLHELSHVLIPAGGDAESRAEARAAATRLVGLLERDPAAFAAIAKAYSACPSRETEGSLGQIGPGQTVPEFETALRGMEPGKIHPEPVETRYGFHIVRLGRRIAGRDLPFELVKARIAEYLAVSARRTAERQYITLLLGRARIEGIELKSASSPLVQ